MLHCNFSVCSSELKHSYRSTKRSNTQIIVLREVYLETTSLSQVTKILQDRSALSSWPALSRRCLTSSLGPRLLWTTWFLLPNSLWCFSSQGGTQQSPRYHTSVVEQIPSVSHRKIQLLAQKLLLFILYWLCCALDAGLLLSQRSCLLLWDNFGRLSWSICEDCKSIS